jgi:2,3-bisphosphoglycerate-dependent phosphoglycerate mutase
MNRPSLLVLIRHGESERNIAKKGNTYFSDEESRKSIRGIPDHMIGLTQNGKEQALQTGLELRSRFGAFDYVYHSGYLRTIETAEGILKAYTEDEKRQLKVRQNLFIRERDPGYAYDMTTAEAEEAFPWLQDYWKTFGGFFANPPGGESLAQVCERVYLFLNMLFRDRAGKRIMVVTHGGTIRAFRFLLERWDYDEATDRFHTDLLSNCSVTVYEYEKLERRLVLKEYNQIYWNISD